MLKSRCQPRRNSGKRNLLFELDVIIMIPRLSTGLRAFDHAVGKFRPSAQAKFNISAFSLPPESLYRPSAIPPIKVLCYAAIVDLFKYLPMSKEQPNDLDIRQKLLIAAWMSLWPTRLEKHG